MTARAGKIRSPAPVPVPAPAAPVPAAFALVRFSPSPRLPRLATLLAVLVLGCKAPPPEPLTATKAATKAAGSPAAKVSTPQRCLTALTPEPPVTPPPVADARCPSEPSPVRRFRSAPLAVAGESLVVEWALSDAEREQGLMYRKRLGENEGMVFDLEAEGPHAFWMHDTCISLDIAFLASDGTVVGIAESAHPLSDEPRQVSCPSRYVLEVPGGWSRRHGLRPGMRINLSN